MTELDWLDANPDCTDEEFWDRMRAVAIQLVDNRSRAFNARLYQLFTEARVNCAERLAVHTEEEQLWLIRKARAGKPLRVYQGVGLDNLASFVSRTDVKLSVRDVEEGGFARPHLMQATILPGNVILRIMDGGRKAILAFPQHLTPVKVNMLQPVQETA